MLVQSRQEAEMRAQVDVGGMEWAGKRRETVLGPLGDVGVQNTIKWAMFLKPGRHPKSKVGVSEGAEDDGAVQRAIQ